MCGFGLGPGDSPGKVDFAGFGRRKCTGNVLERPVLGLGNKEDNEEQKDHQKSDEYQKRVLLHYNLHLTRKTTVYKFVLLAGVACTPRGRHKLTPAPQVQFLDYWRFINLLTYSLRPIGVASYGTLGHVTCHPALLNLQLCFFLATPELLKC